MNSTLGVIIVSLLGFVSSYFLGKYQERIKTLELLRKEVWKQENSMEVVKFIGNLVDKF